MIGTGRFGAAEMNGERGEGSADLNNRRLDCQLLSTKSGDFAASRPLDAKATIRIARSRTSRRLSFA